ncbi:MAG TPA: patatin-like phospholipase family protein [Acholeplasmataceae bacterium]|nr:patatin-like phospholipase family protein [Acholeplasmataceae bacterium]
MFINGVFEGGGIKGLAYIGVIRFLEERGFRFLHAGGSSVGSLFASLILARYNSYDLEELVKNFDLNILITSKAKKPIQKFINGIKYKGLYTMKYFENYLRNILASRGITTFRDLKMGEDYLLKIVVTDIKNRKMITIPNDLAYYNYSKDNFPVAKAVAMSCSIPIVFVPYKINENSFVDGGVTNNFPINLFKDSKVPTLGFKLSETTKKTSIITKYKDKLFNIKTEVKFDDYNVVEINTAGYKATDFKKGLENYQELIKLGYNSMRDYFYRKH